MIDKLELMQNLAKKHGYSILLPQENISTNSEDSSLSEFTNLINDGKELIKGIEKNNENLEDCKNELENPVGKEEQERISNNINTILTSVQTKQRQMKTIIQNLSDHLQNLKQDKSNDENIDTSSNKKDSSNPEIRIKQNLFGSLVNKYQRTCQKFQENDNEIKEIMQRKIVRSAEIALGKQLNDEEKANFINNPKAVQEIYEEQVSGTAHISLQNAVADLEERHKEIQNLEKSIIAVHNLILELSQIVMLQGEMIDNIEENISSAKDYVQKAEKKLAETKEIVKKNRKCKCWILFVLLGVVIAIVVVCVVLKIK